MFWNLSPPLMKPPYGVKRPLSYSCPRDGISSGGMILVFTSQTDTLKLVSLVMAMLLFLYCDLWSIIGDAGFVVSSLVSSASAFFSFHLLTGKMGTRPCNIAVFTRTLL